MDIKETIQKTCYYGYFFCLAITIYAGMNEAAFVLTGKSDISAMTFLFPLLCFLITLFIKRIGALKDE